jgi:phenylacetate-coenzyme A ligase PaaK-like adenylate-forming protein
MHLRTLFYNKICLPQEYRFDNWGGGYPERAGGHANWIQKFGAIWPQITLEVPYWKQFRGRSISSYDDFSRLPILCKESLRRSMSDYESRDASRGVWVATGGSTGRPLALRLYRSELEVGRRNQIRARAAYGIRPGDRCFIFWGAPASLEGGARRLLYNVDRSLKDWVLGYKRFSAYDLTPQSLRSGWEKMVAWKPKWIYAYSTALLSFVRANSDRSRSIKKLALKACILAAEGIREDEREELEDYFGCRVGMEYGSVELRVCAHTHPEFHGFHIFSEDYLIEAQPTSASGVFNILVTKLFPAAVPLVRYAVGDQIVVDDPKFTGGIVSKFAQVFGRENDNLVLSDGTSIHSEAVTHSIRCERDVLGFQFRQSPDKLLLTLMMAGDVQVEGVKARIANRLRRINALLGATKIEIVSQLESTPAGKRRWIVRER